MMAQQESKPRPPTPSSPRTPSRRWPPFNPGRRAGVAAGVFGIACGCVDSKAVAVSPSPADTAAYLSPAAPGGVPDGADSYPPYPDTDSRRYQRRLSKSGSLSFTTATTVRSTTTSSSSSNALAKSSSRLTRSSEEPPGEGAHQEPHRLSTDSAGGSSSYSGLLRQLSELETSARDWSPARRAVASGRDSSDESPASPARASTDVDDRQRNGRRGAAGGSKSSSLGRREAHGSVVVVKDTEDPVGEFRRSMLAMVADRGMACAEELRELLVWFLALNAPENHGLVLLAFARVCQDVLRNSNLEQQPSPSPVTPEPCATRRWKQRQPTPRRRSRCCRGTPSPAAASYCCDQ